eukprot:3044698-Pyramimonas_sp.AAC.1
MNDRSPVRTVDMDQIGFHNCGTSGTQIHPSVRMWTGMDVEIRVGDMAHTNLPYPSRCVKGRMSKQGSRGHAVGEQKLRITSG